MLLDYHSELMFQENSAFSQPYYSRHNWYQAKTDMVKPFLSTYYHTVAPHADRQTYTFWEHMYKLSAHKTHEEANFLMETRWMLYMEDADTLHLFRVAPGHGSPTASGSTSKASGVISDGSTPGFAPMSARDTSRRPSRATRSGNRRGWRFACRILRAKNPSG